MRLWILALALLSFPVGASELDGKGFLVEGIISVIDGDTIRVKTKTFTETVRLHGIDAPEKSQICQIDGLDWTCGREAADILKGMYDGSTVSCVGKKRGRYARLIAVCHTGLVKVQSEFPGTDLGGIMVELGLALAYREYSNDYVEAENKAKADKVGMWRGTFVPPWEWRKRTKLFQ